MEETIISLGNRGVGGGDAKVGTISPISVLSTYICLKENRLDYRSDEPWKFLWNNKIEPLKAVAFIWRALQNIIPTRRT